MANPVSCPTRANRWWSKTFIRLTRSSARESARVVPPPGLVGQPDAPLVDGDDREVSGQRPASPNGVPVLRPAVHQQQRRASTTHHHVLAQSAGPDEVALLNPAGSRGAPDAENGPTGPGAGTAVAGRIHPPATIRPAVAAAPPANARRDTPRGISREAEREDGPPCETTEDVFMRPPLASLPVELCRRVSSMQPRPGLPRTPGRELDPPAPLSRWHSGRRSPARTVSAFVASGWSPEPVCFASGHTRRRRESTLRRLRRV